MKKTHGSRTTRGDSYLRIWNAVRKVPRGYVTTYGVIAAVAGLPSQARLAGYALHNLPDGADVPWHRVVNAQGKISLPRARGSGRRQMSLLRSEGIRFTNGKIPLRVYGWPRRLFGSRSPKRR